MSDLQSLQQMSDRGCVPLRHSKMLTVDGGDGDSWDTIMLGFCEYGDEYWCPKAKPRN